MIDNHALPWYPIETHQLARHAQPQSYPPREYISELLDTAAQSCEVQIRRYKFGARTLTQTKKIFCREIPKSREGLKLSGDMFATTMGWLGDVDAGGGTAFTSNSVEKVSKQEIKVLI